MILSNLDAVTEKIAKMGFLFPNFFYRHLTKCGEDVFYCRRSYVVWHSFEKIGVETAEKVCFEKNMMVVPHAVTQRGRP